MTRTRLTRLLLWCTGVLALSLPALAVPLLQPQLSRAYAGGCGLEWRVVVSPNHGNIDNRLYGVEAITENAVWATGTDDAGFASHSLFLRWNGSTWAEIQSPNPSSFYNYFFALGATSPANVWSMGHYGNTSSSNLMIARLAGNLWSRVTIPTVAATLNYMYGDLASISDTDVWAVSYQAGAQVTTTLTLHGDGNTFNIVPSPNVGSFNNYLSGVADVEPNDIWAGGAYSNGAAYRTLTMRWDGTQWNIVPSPSVGTGDNGIYRMSASSSANVWAVGHYMESSTVTRTLALQWDGAQWNITPGLNPGISSRFNDVAALAPDDVWAVGRQVTTDGSSETMIQHWDGTQWALVPSPNVGATFNDLQSISALSPTDIWAAGHYVDSNRTFRTLVLRYNDPCGGTVTPTASAVAATPSATSTRVSTATFTPTSAAAPSNTAQPTLTRTSTPASSATPTSGVTIVPTTATTIATETPPPASTETPERSPTSTSTVQLPAQTATPCGISFTDVPPGHTFYPFIRCLACRGIINGYPDGTFRPGNDVTRGQLSKIVSNAAGFNEPVSGQTFIDVPPGSTFYEFIERMAARDIIAGYPDGTFRPGNSATRGQIAKIVSNAAGFNEPVSGQTFSDVPPGSTFYEFIERMATRSIIVGYPDGTFRPGNNATRGQVSKMVTNAFFADCNPGVSSSDRATVPPGPGEGPRGQRRL